MIKKIKYTPMFFLSALWTGGLTVSFFMYLMFLTKHPDSPIPTFDSLMLYFTSSDHNLWMQAMIIFALLAIIYFASLHIKLLIWNLVKFFEYKKTDDYKKLKTTNAEVSLMAFPLALAMSVNVVFILWALFIPGLWWIVEYLFPVSLLIFFSIGILALKIFTQYFSRLLLTGAFDFIQNNNLSQMMAIFAFAMVAVWFSASAAMSTNYVTVMFWLIGSLFFITLAIFFSVLKIILGFKSILKQWIAKESSPTLWAIIPILTLIWITFIRQKHWFHTGLDISSSSGSVFILTVVLLSLQMMFGYIWYKVMKENGYFDEYITWDTFSPSSYALLCPGVAMVVLWFFFVHLGVVKAGIIEQFSFVYFVLLSPFLFLQFKTIHVMKKLNKKMFLK